MVCMIITSLAKLLKFQPFINFIAHRSIISTSTLNTCESNFFPHQKHLLKKYIYAHKTLTRTFLDVNKSKLIRKA